MKKYILALDQGTSSSRAILFDKEYNIIGVEQKEFNSYYPKSTWVEQDPIEIIKTQFFVAQQLLKNLQIDAADIAGIGITNQRETTVAWDKNTGKPVYNAIVWQDKRTSGKCNNLKETSWKEYINEKTGLWIDSYFSATKIEWILENVPSAIEKVAEKNLYVGTIDSWLVWNLTKGKVHITDYTNACRTMLFDIKKLDWDQNLLKLFSIPKSILPKVVDNQTIVGYTDKEIFGEEIPIVAPIGDQQSALFGQLCLEPGTAKNTYGTGCFVLMNTGTNVFYSKNGLLSTIAWGLDGKINYAVEGSVFIAGAAIKWLRDSLNLITNVRETEDMANSLEDNDGVYFVPAFSGLGAPYWDMDVRGAITGLTQNTTKEHIVRATLESLAFQTYDMIDAMQNDTNIKLDQLFVDGGASSNNFLMQFQSNILNSDVIRPENIETTALGAAFIAGLATEFVTKEELKKIKKVDTVFKSQIDEIARIKLLTGWKKAIENIRKNK